jgi:transcriptional regulator with XRE-family HTH domain
MSRQAKGTSSGVSFADRFSEALDGTTLESFARSIDRPLRTVQRWKSGSSEPHGANLILLARALGRDPEWFYPDDESVEEAA